MHANWFLVTGMFSTVGEDGIVLDAAALLSGDEAGAIELPGMLNDATDVFAVVAPAFVAATDLSNAASVAVYGCAGGGVRAFVHEVGHAVVVFVAVIGGWRGEFEDPPIFRAKRGGGFVSTLAGG